MQAGWYITAWLAAEKSDRNSLNDKKSLTKCVLTLSES